jgi:predicted anti-sigma-YlaC factor YlaD
MVLMDAFLAVLVLQQPAAPGFKVDWAVTLPADLHLRTTRSRGCRRG